MPLLRLLTPNRLCLLVAIWIVATSNASFWKLFHAVQGANWAFAISLAVALAGLNLALARLLSPGRALRFSLSVLLLLAATAGWFMDTYGVALDSEMLRNAWDTNPAEARDFLGLSLAWRLLWAAALPIAFVWWVPLPLAEWWRAARDWVFGILAGIALVFIAGLPLYSSYASYFRNQHTARYLIAPANVVVGTVRLVRKAGRVAAPHVVVGADARRDVAPHAKPLLVVLVVGETARAANFSLGGYARDTNPLLAKRGVFYYTDVTACGTSTAVSLPCMFSDLPRDEFRIGDAGARDSVLDILQRTGLAVRWIDNQSGCKDACDRVASEKAETYLPSACKDGECLDATLPRALEQRLAAIDRDTVLVLHAMGSHGPSYYRRVPPEGVVFQPTCATERIETCSDEQIVNAYDNSIRYTDSILDTLAGQLDAAAEQVDSVLLYVSDHGESLGESGLYLHGQPWMLAPDVQKKVPMLLWFSAGSPARLALDTACLRATLGRPVSHDNLSHTLLGLGDVVTGAYRPRLDLLRACRRG